MLGSYVFPCMHNGVHDPADKRSPLNWATELSRYSVCGAGNKTSHIRTLPLPVPNNIPPLVVSNAEISMDDIATGTVIVPANLSHGCQVLYANVAGPNIQLTSKDFPDFPKAIEHSIVTSGCICYTLLRKKADSENLGGGLKGTYLRITLGVNLGDSPGKPFVLEIWPAGHYSPIHNHSDADAVIKVLHGSIQSKFFQALSPPHVHSFQEVTLKPGDVTWLSKYYYRTHQLHNITEKMCATLQCYRYPDDNTEHYEYFDYLDACDSTIKQFFPASDMDFIEFKQRVKTEWNEYKHSSDGV